MFYFLIVCYNIHDLCLDDHSTLCGPYSSEKERADALKKDLAGRDLETDQIANVTLLKVSESKLVPESSYLVDESDCEDDEDDN